jgi:hypothetical protein
MNKILAILATCVAVSPALAEEPGVKKRALELCGPMAACRTLVEENILPARFVVACYQAMDPREDLAIRKSAQEMCNTAFADILKTKTAKR